MAYSWTWRPTSDQREVYEEWKNHALGFLVSSQDGIRVYRFGELLGDYVEEKVPLEEMGFPTFNHFLYEMSDSIDVRTWTNQNGREELLVFINEYHVPQHMKHIRDMVNRQAKPKAKKDRNGRTIKMTKRNSVPVRPADLLKHAPRGPPRPLPPPSTIVPGKGQPPRRGPPTSRPVPSSSRTPYFQAKTMRPPAPMNGFRSLSDFKPAPAAAPAYAFKGTTASGEPLLSMVSHRPQSQPQPSTSRGCDVVDATSTTRRHEDEEEVPRGVPRPPSSVKITQAYIESSSDSDDFDYDPLDDHLDDEDDYRPIRNYHPRPPPSQPEPPVPVKSINDWAEPEEKKEEDVKKVPIVSVREPRPVEKILRDPRSARFASIPAVPVPKPSTSQNGAQLKAVEKVARYPDLYAAKPGPSSSKAVETVAIYADPYAENATSSRSEQEAVQRIPRDPESRAVTSTADGSFKITVTGNKPDPPRTTTTTPTAATSRVILPPVKVEETKPPAKPVVVPERRDTAVAVEAFSRSFRPAGQAQSTSGESIPVQSVSAGKPILAQPAPPPQPLRKVLTESNSITRVPATAAPAKVPMFNPSLLGNVSPRHSVESIFNFDRAQQKMKCFENLKAPLACAFPRVLPRKPTKITLSLKAFMDYYMGKRATSTATATA